MKKNYTSTFLGAAALFLALYSCDKIDGPYREGTTKGITYLNSDSVVIDGDTIGFSTDNSTPGKKVLAEDYTGILCGNCPYAGLKLNDTIKPAYGDRLIVISVHAGFFAEPCPNGLACPGNQPAGALTNDFRCTTGNEWDAFFGNSNAGNPNGLIDRMDYPGRTHIKAPSLWATKIQARSTVASPFAIRMQAHYDPSTREVKAAVQSRAAQALTGTYKLSVVVVEDSIVDWQEWYPPVTPEFDPNYLHRNVLRTALNSSFGEVVADGTVASGARFLKAYKYTLSSLWNSRHCKLVAFVYDASTYEVKQVEEVAVQ